MVAALDNHPVLSSSYPHNFPNTRLILRDASDIDGEVVRAESGGQVDGVVGGPPCQGFSAIGRRSPEDPRRLLISHFFRIVRELQPSFFVMENVRGLGYSNARRVLDEALDLVRDQYAILGPQVWDAAQFGAATKRSRLFVIGIHQDYGETLTAEDVDAFRREPATVRAAIGDLEGARPLGEDEGFDTWQITRNCLPFDYAHALRSADGHFTGHRITAHSKRVRIRFHNVPGGRHRLGWTPPTPIVVRAMSFTSCWHRCRSGILPSGPTDSSRASARHHGEGGGPAPRLP